MADRKLQPASIEWATKHLATYGDCDLLPVPFEYEALAVYEDVRSELTKEHFGKWSTRGVLSYQIPKLEGGFRIATRLDPLDATIYTAALYECAAQIEARRVAGTVACAYRIAPQPDGRFFAQDRGWDRFTDLSIENSSAGFIASADVADFYPRISTHRVCNALEKSGVDKARAADIEKLLLGWSESMSTGIPVGAKASILIAEAILHDVDRRLVELGYKHVRFVDDFRIFCETKGRACEALHDLSKYLFEAHRLTLQPQKTRVEDTFDFLGRLEAPAIRDRIKKKEKLRAQLAASSSPYESEPEEPPSDSDVQHVDFDVLAELFVESLEGTTVRGGDARWLLSQAAHHHSDCLLEHVLLNLERLVPLFGRVCRYLARVAEHHEARRASIVDAIVQFAHTSHYAFLPYVQEWVLHMFVGPLCAYVTKEHVKAAAAWAKTCGLRAGALAAVALEDDSWVRSQKTNWRNVGLWDRRAIIRAGAMLSVDERRAWRTKQIETAGDLADIAVASHWLGG